MGNTTLEGLSKSQRKRNKRRAREARDAAAAAAARTNPTPTPSSDLGSGPQSNLGEEEQIPEDEEDVDSDEILPFQPRRGSLPNAPVPLNLLDKTFNDDRQSFNADSPEAHKRRSFGSTKRKRTRTPSDDESPAQPEPPAKKLKSVAANRSTHRHPSPAAIDHDPPDLSPLPTQRGEAKSKSTQETSRKTKQTPLTTERIGPDDGWDVDVDPEHGRDSASPTIEYTSLNKEEHPPDLFGKPHAKWAPIVITAADDSMKANCIKRNQANPGVRFYSDVNFPEKNAPVLSGYLNLKSTWALFQLVQMPPTGTCVKLYNKHVKVDRAQTTALAPIQKFINNTAEDILENIVNQPSLPLKAPPNIPAFFNDVHTRAVAETTWIIFELVAVAPSHFWHPDHPPNTGDLWTGPLPTETVWRCLLFLRFAHSHLSERKTKLEKKRLNPASKDTTRTLPDDHPDYPGVTVWGKRPKVATLATFLSEADFNDPRLTVLDESKSTRADKANSISIALANLVAEPFEDEDVYEPIVDQKWSKRLGAMVPTVPNLVNDPTTQARFDETQKMFKTLRAHHTSKSTRDLRASGLDITDRLAMALNDLKDLCLWCRKTTKVRYDAFEGTSALDNVVNLATDTVDEHAIATETLGVSSQQMLKTHRTNFWAVKQKISTVSADEPTFQEACQALHLDPTRPQILGQDSDLRLHEWQVSAILWMKNQERSDFKCGIIADDCGLGKTITSLSLIVRQDDEVNHDPIFGYRPTLVVAPRPIVMEWLNDHERFFGRHVQVRLLMGSPTDKKNPWAGITLPTDPFAARERIAREFHSKYATSARVIILTTYGTYHKRCLMSHYTRDEQVEVIRENTRTRK
ncbi:MAG: hypothetical protein M1823_006119 [Watsoniomyces obsoletus]|nr:MAG: hypothetical protein M1823_006119 [Watsoniomyces obsoletus]